MLARGGYRIATAVGCVRTFPNYSFLLYNTHNTMSEIGHNAAQGTPSAYDSVVQLAMVSKDIIPPDLLRERLTEQHSEIRGRLDWLLHPWRKPQQPPPPELRLEHYSIRATDQGVALFAGEKIVQTISGPTKEVMKAVQLTYQLAKILCNCGIEETKESGKNVLRALLKAFSSGGILGRTPGIDQDLNTARNKYVWPVCSILLDHLRCLNRNAYDRLGAQGAGIEKREGWQQAKEYVDLLEGIITAIEEVQKSKVTPTPTATRQDLSV